MKSDKIFIFCTIFVFSFLAGFLNAKDYTSQNYFSDLSGVKNKADVINLYKEYITNSEEMELLDNIIQSWSQIDPDAMSQFISKLMQENPASYKYPYLKGLISQTPLEIIGLGRKTVELAPDRVYGYRLITLTYVNDLFLAEKETAETLELKNEFKNDEKYFTGISERDPDKNTALKVQFEYEMYKGRLDQASAVLEKAEKEKVPWFSKFETARVSAKAGKFDDVLKAVTEEVNAKVASGKGDEASKPSMINYYYGKILRMEKAYKEMVKYLTGLQDFESNAELLYNAGCYYTLLNDHKNALTCLKKAAAKGWDDYDQVQTDEDLLPLHKNPDWQELVNSVKLNWDRGSESRKDQALTQKADRDAPSFALVNAEGDSVKLRDYKGKIVVLDFWATWCLPCKYSMPQIDSFARNQSKDDVRVFSINVWDSNREKAKNFIKQNGYSMELLFGNNDLAASYGFNSIPYICVIDGNGKIRFEQRGFKNGLADNLKLWVEELQKQEKEQKRN